MAATYTGTARPGPGRVSRASVTTIADGLMLSTTARAMRLASVMAARRLLPHELLHAAPGADFGGVEIAA